LSLDSRAGYAGASARGGLGNWDAQGAAHHSFNRALISSSVLRRHGSFLPAVAVFSGGICFACAHCGGETLFVSGDRRQLRAVSSWSVRLLFLAVAENDSVFLSRYREPGMGANLDGVAVLFFRDAVHYWIRSGIRIAGGRAGTGQIRIDHLQIHGAHPAVRSGV